MIDVDVTNFGAVANGMDSTPAVNAAIQYLSSLKGPKRLAFPKGRYHFWPDRAPEALLFPANHDCGLKRMGLRCEGLSDLVIDGHGSYLVFHGDMIPIAFFGCRHISLRRLSIDFQRPFHSESQIVGTGDGFVDLEIDPDAFPFKVVDRQLHFHFENGKDCEPAYLLEFDGVRREPAFQVNERWIYTLNAHAEQLAVDRVRYFATFGSPVPKVGNILVFGPAQRKYPGIYCKDSADLAIQDVWIHHAGGMGLIAQCCENVSLQRVAVTPPPGSKRTISVTADATHFVQCRGQVEIRDCLFEKQLDDATNIHGIYAKVSRLLDNGEVELQLAHTQQRGADVLHEGDQVEAIHADTLAPYFASSIRTMKRINSEFLIVSFTQALPLQMRVGDAIGNLSWAADVTIYGCTARNNRARGFLISTPGHVLIENNRFHNGGSAILIEGDANSWFESGAVRDVTIRGNFFDNCNYGPWGLASIQITPAVAPEVQNSVRYHQGIRICSNQFRSWGPPSLLARCTTGITFENNQIAMTNAYPRPAQQADSIDIRYCSDVAIQPPSGSAEVRVATDATDNNMANHSDA